MSKSTKRTKRQKSVRKARRTFSIPWGFVRRAGIGLGILGLSATAVGALAYGTLRLDGFVKQELVGSASPVPVFVNLPPELAPYAELELRALLDDLLLRDWVDHRLCRDIAERLARSGWVAEVNHVRRTPDARFEINCRYRLPFAEVRTGENVCLVDREGFRLPGRYERNLRRLLISGVAEPPPEAGSRWTGDDLQAGLAISDQIMKRTFRNQITGVEVENLKGRKNSRRVHIQLLTDRSAGKIGWGSPIGMETEENTAIQKLAILEANYRTTGRVDAGHAVIDVSTFPDRFTIPG